jgi:hypothetical protein
LCRSWNLEVWGHGPAEVVDLVAGELQLLGDQLADHRVVHGDLAQGVLVITVDLEMLGNDLVLTAAFVAAGLKHGDKMVS